MRVAATIEVPGKVLVIADCVEPLDGVCIKGAIPGGALFIGGVERGIVVGLGPIDYETFTDVSGRVCDFTTHSTTLDCYLDL